jgi:site-specific DNA-methyltransferase (adenine-specific)
MTGIGANQASFTLRGRNPDVLSCIANLSNDEVFTPPEFANRMLDTLAEGWAAGNKGADIWADSKVTFLDPCTKSGVFLREIAKRLIAGLEGEIPDLQARVDHILTKQVFGIATTRLTSLMARRSLYCSKDATGKHSVAKGAASADGNVWWQRTEHEWVGGRCRFCGAPKAIFDRNAEFETHAYAFIHGDDPKNHLTKLFGDNMQFDVIIGNPPYQMTGGGGGFDSSIYHLFVEQAISLEPRFISMVTPSRWLAGGYGLDEYRAKMLSSGTLRDLVDFPVANEAFPGVEIKGGISYFLWDVAHNGPTKVTTVRGESSICVERNLGEFDVFLRDSRAIPILRKVMTRAERPVIDILTGVEPFKWASNYVPIYFIRNGKRETGYVSLADVPRNPQLVAKWKVLVPKGYGAGETVPHQILGKPWIAPSPSVCSGSFMFFHVDSEDAAQSLQSYYSSRFFRFLVSLRKITQDAIRSTYQWVPMQTWDRTWTDAALYEKYGINDEEIAFIESMIRPMQAGDE